MGLGLTKTSSKSSKKNNTTSSTTPQTTAPTTTASGGNTYQVQSNGKAPSGLSVGDNVVTQGGTYQITGVNADGTYQSTLVGGTSNNTTSTTSPSQYTGTTSGSTMPSGFSGSANGVTTYNQGQSDILAEMNANSIAWHTASPEEKKQLAARNQALSQLLGGSVTFDANTGYWSGAAEAPVEVGEEPVFDYSVAQPNFGNSYGNALDEMLNKILTREDFKYNAEDDPLYQQYAEMYRREGDRARENTLADIASSAGGMNSWAVTAAQQAQNNYNAQLGDKIPELYQLAYQMYLNEKASMVEDFGLLQQMDSTQYNRYRDTMSDWRDDRNFAFDYYLSDWDNYKWGTEFNYGVSQDQIANDNYNKEWDYGVSTDQYNREQAENETAYNREQAERDDAYNRVLDIISAGGTPSQELLNAAGVSAADAAALIASAQATGSKSSGGGGSSSGGGGEVTMDLDGLFESALASGSPEVYLQNSSYLKKYGVGKYSDELVDAYEEWAEEKENAQLQRVLENSTTNLGIGPVDADWVEETLRSIGAVVITADGYKWAEGWNANNYKEKLNAYQTGNLSGMSGSLWWSN